ncbi:MAG: tetratricopeptide repeat protein [Opitutales bacterium]
MPERDPQELVDEATFEFTLGNHETALALLAEALAAAPESFAGWLAKAEIHFDQRDLDAALEAAERALALDPDDVHANTSLSRIWMERGDKERAEHFGAQARIKGWKVELKSDPDEA